MHVISYFYFNNIINTYNNYLSLFYSKLYTTPQKPHGMIYVNTYI